MWPKLSGLAARPLAAEGRNRLTAPPPPPERVLWAACKDDLRARDVALRALARLIAPSREAEEGRAQHEGMPWAPGWRSVG